MVENDASQVKYPLIYPRDSKNLNKKIVAKNVVKLG